MSHYFKHLYLLAFVCSSLFGEDCFYSDIIKNCVPEQTQAMEEARSALGWNEQTQFHPLQGGLSRAKLYSFESDSQEYVLRFLALGPNQPDAVRQNEIQALNISSKLGIAPRCVFSDQHAVLMVMPFIKGKPLYKPDNHQLTQLGKMIRALHDYSGAYPKKYIFNERLDRQYQKGLKAGTAYPSGFDKEVQAVLSKHSNRLHVPTHADLNPTNILASEDRISIIDWTSATIDDPFTDLSYFALLANLSCEQEKIFLEAYFGRAPTTEECTVLDEEKTKIYLLTATIWLRFYETQEELSTPLAPRVAALDAELQSPNLKPAQEYLRDQIVVDMNTAPKHEIRAFALSFYKAYLAAKKLNK